MAEDIASRHRYQGGFRCSVLVEQNPGLRVPIGAESCLELGSNGSRDLCDELIMVDGILAEVIAFDHVLRTGKANLPIDHRDLAMVAQVEARAPGAEEAQRQRQGILDAGFREPLSHLFEFGAWARAQVVQQDAHLNAPLAGAFQRRDNALRLFVAAQCEILDMDKTLCAVDLLGDTLQSSKEVGREFDAIPTEGRETAEIGIELDKWLVARWNRRFQQRVKLVVALSLSHSFSNRVIHGVLHCTTALRELGAADEKEDDEPQKRYDVHEQEPGSCR